MDNSNELLDLVDEKDGVIGTVKRGIANQDPKLIHRAVAIAVFNKRGELFLQKRSAGKDVEPGAWSISCSGHVESGFGYDESAHRELEEELGKDLVIKPIETFLCRYPWETEMTRLYKGYCEGPFNLQKEEIEDGKFFSHADVEKLLRNKKEKVSLLLREILKRMRWE